MREYQDLREYLMPKPIKVIDALCMNLKVIFSLPPVAEIMCSRDGKVYTIILFLLLLELEINLIS